MVTAGAAPTVHKIAIMPKRVSPLSARAVDSLKEGQEKADGALPGLRVRNVSGERVWSLFVVPPKAATKRRFEVGRGLSLAEARAQGAELRKHIREGRDPTSEKKSQRHVPGPQLRASAR